MAGVHNKECLHPLVVSGVDTYGHVEFHVPVDCSVVYRRHFLLALYNYCFCVADHRLGSSPPFPFPSLFLLFQQCDGCLFLLLHGGSWLSCQHLPAMGAVFIYEMAANSGSPWMSQAPNHHFSNAVVNIGVTNVEKFGKNKIFERYRAHAQCCI